jgi:ParB family chromosome partitioning protein
VANKQSLGKGFQSLLPKDFDNSILLDQSERIQKVIIDNVTPNKSQPRKDFDQESIVQLSGSIKQFGILQPLIVRPVENNEGQYEIVAGERRWRASKIAGLSHIPVIVRTAEKIERLEIALVENVQRVDLSALEQALSIDRLHNQFNISYKDIASRLNKAEPTIINIVRLLQLPPKAKLALEKKQISEGHARAILALKDKPDAQERLLQNIVKLHWSVRQAEQFVQANKSTHNPSKDVRAHMEKETSETKQLGKRLSTSVTIKRLAHGGKLEISFKTDEELNKIITELLSS